MIVIAATEIEDFECANGDGDAEDGIVTECGDAMLLHVECFAEHLTRCNVCAGLVAGALDEG